MKKNEEDDEYYDGQNLYKNIGAYVKIYIGTYIFLFCIEY